MRGMGTRSVHSLRNLSYTQIMLKDLSFPPGEVLERPGAIRRFLPPLESGLVKRALNELGGDPGLIIDPFGVSPMLAAEVAEAGSALLLASNNPISRFIIRQELQPIPQGNLQSALARFASFPKDGMRLEPFILDLYRTLCSRCGSSISAQHFIWEKETQIPILKIYHCNHCGHQAQEPTSEVDRGRAQSYTRRGLHFAMALEALAPANDAYRRHAEAALAVYPGRSLFAIITLITKLDQFEGDPHQLRAARALLLYVCDACNALWDYPDGRIQPRKLSLAAQYKETNVWHAMVRAVEVWTHARSPVQVTEWPAAALPAPGSVAIFAGGARKLVETLPVELKKSILTVLPRPNHAFWTLAALWTAWLWGREEAQGIKVALHRRRYDWAWHARALNRVLNSLTFSLERGAYALTFLPDVEPGFLAAALAGIETSGFKLRGRAFRDGESQALLQWQVEPIENKVVLETDLNVRIQNAVLGTLQTQGEPASYSILHAAALTELSAESKLGLLWKREGANPQTMFAGMLDRVLVNRQILRRLGRGRESESGHYWLTDSSGAAEPLSDRLELFILQLLRREEGLTTQDIYTEVYRRFPGLYSPNRRLVDICLRSYAENIMDGWSIRPEDKKAWRDRDRKEIIQLIKNLGTRLDWKVEGDDPIQWKDAEGDPGYYFRVQETAVVGTIIDHEDHPIILVIPGGRSGIILAKARRDPRIMEWVGRATRVVKFRHIRRLEAETALNRENFDRRLAIDPPDQHDPQLPLF